MDAKAFRTAVNLVKPSGVSQSALDEAIEYFATTLLQTAQSDVSKCVQLAGRIGIWRASAKDEEQIPTKRLFPLTAGNIARSNNLTEVITRDVEQIRQELFGSPQPPFCSIEEAAAWIKKAGEQQDDFSPEERQRRQDLRKEICDKLREWSRLTGEAVPGYPGRPRYLPYIVRANGQLWEYPYCVRPGFPLAKLEEDHETSRA